MGSLNNTDPARLGTAEYVLLLLSPRHLASLPPIRPPSVRPSVQSGSPMMIESTIIFRIPPMPSDVSFPPHVQKKFRGGRGRSATTSTASAAGSRSRSTATAPATAAAPCPNSKFTKYSVAALEAALGNDIERLHSFAANTELSGENIIFLKSVEMWKARWRHCGGGGEQKRKRWQEAHDIWRHLVDRDTAEFPLNIEDAVYRNLERVFGAASTAEGKSCIVPFADDIALGRHSRGGTTGSSGFPAATAELTLFKETLRIATVAPKALPSEHEWMSPPPMPTRKEEVEVALEVFDKAEASVRQMVLENTWVRYVDSLSETCADVLMSSSSPPAGCSWRWKSVFRKKSYTKFLGASERD